MKNKFKPFEEFLTTNIQYAREDGVSGCAGMSGTVGVCQNKFDPYTGKPLEYEESASTSKIVGHSEMFLPPNSIIIRIPGEKDINVGEKLKELEAEINFLEICQDSSENQAVIMECMLLNLEDTIKKQNKKIKKLKKRKK